MGVDYSFLEKINPDDMPEVIKTLPDRPMVTEDQWNAIRNYYMMNAPDSIAQTDATALPEVEQFNVSELILPVENNSLITVLRFDSLTSKLFIGTRMSKLYQVNSALELEDSFQLESPPSDIIFQQDFLPIISSMGIMDPNDQPRGKIVQLSKTNEQKILVDSLKRPVHIQKTDLNNDHQDDFVVAAFGNYTGALIVYEKIENGYKRHVVHNLPGTRKTIIQDFNGDGLNDILALITQGDEQITLFINDGNFKFNAQILLRFSPVYGSSYFDVHDFNQDGKFDILFTNGDNADFSSVLKPYHGIRIFLNEGNNNFKESWFYPMHGASQAVARDFDMDGDLDIAAISFFPDFENHPEQSFLYFENNRGKFIPSITPLASSGRWLVMEAADIDNDADEDLLLGALNFTASLPEHLLTQWKEKRVSVLIMRNILH